MLHLPPEIRTQLTEQKKQCIFCKISKKEVPGKIVFEDEKIIALLDIYPAVKGDTLYLLKEHYPLLLYASPDESSHYFSLIPQLAKAIKEGMVCTAINIFMANGQAAGQQGPHFLSHIMPREENDGFFNFLFKPGKVLAEEEKVIIKKNLPHLMDNNFTKNPVSWHNGTGERPSFLHSLAKEKEVIYEDEKVLVLLPSQPATPGHIEIYSKTQEKDLTKLSAEDSKHFFQTASVAASLVFEGFKAQGTNVIVKSGVTDDNRSGRLVVHVLPRKAGDKLEGLNWEPKQPSYDLDNVAGKIKDKCWKIKLEKESKLDKEVKNKEEISKKIEIKEEKKISTNDSKKIKTLPTNELEEIRKAIEKMR